MRLVWLALFAVFGLFVGAHVQHAKRIVVLEEMLKENPFQNTVKYDGDKFYLYGLEGAGTVGGKYHAYYPVYVGAQDLANMANEHRRIIYQAAKDIEEINDEMGVGS